MKRLIFKKFKLTRNLLTLNKIDVYSGSNKNSSINNPNIKYFSSILAREKTQDSLNESERNFYLPQKNNAKLWKIIPIKVNEVVLPYGKSTRIQKTKELENLFKNAKKGEEYYVCAFLFDEKKNKTTNIGVIIENIHVHQNSEEISLTSKESDCRVYANEEELEAYFDLNNVNIDEKLTSIDIKPMSAFSIEDDNASTQLFSDEDIALNLISDINKQIFSFYEISSNRNLEPSVLREVNNAIILIQNILKTNMEFLSKISRKFSTNEFEDLNMEDHENKNTSLFDILNDKEKDKKETKKVPKTKEINSLIFENIQEFLRIAKSFRKSYPYKDAFELIKTVDPIKRTRMLIQFIYEIGDFLIKDLHMLEEYKKDVMQKQEKYLLRYVKKQVDKLASGENSENYKNMLEKLYSQGDINEQTKRSIQLEIDLAFNSNVQTSENDVEDRKKFSILEDIFNFPWGKRQEVVYDVKYCTDTLNKNLYGLKTVKTRIEEYVAKLKRNKTEKNKGFIILITGPPGTGKTTIAQLIGQALQRKTGIINLSGETDTINLKGSRRTYIDSQPSIFFKEISKLGVRNPVIILDEIDKIANRGDRTSHSAASALLELLNPEENHNFIDQYLNIPLDFSETVFICTSNYNVNLLEPLLDRVEILEIDDYTFKEKMEISEKYLIPRIMKDYGLNDYSISQESTEGKSIEYQNNNIDEMLVSSTKEIDNLLSTTEQINESVKIRFPEKVLEDLIKNYTIQSTGCRGIKRSLEKLIRKINYNFYKSKDETNLVITEKHLIKYLGQTTNDSNLNKLIKESGKGYLCSDSYGNIGRLILKAKPYVLKEKEIDSMLKESNLNSIFKHIDLQIKLSKPVKESLDTAIHLCRKLIKKYLKLNFPCEKINLLQPLTLYKTHPYQEKIGNSFGLVFLVALFSHVFEFQPIKDNILILGELNSNGNVLKTVNLKYILNSCEYYNISSLILPEGKFFI